MPAVNAHIADRRANSSSVRRHSCGILCNSDGGSEGQHHEQTAAPVSRNRRKRKGEIVPRVARWPIPNLVIPNVLRPESQRPRLQALEKVILQAKAQRKARKEEKGKGAPVVSKVPQTNRHLLPSTLSL